MLESQATLSKNSMNQKINKNVSEFVWKHFCSSGSKILFPQQCFLKVGKRSGHDTVNHDPRFFNPNPSQPKKRSWKTGTRSVTEIIVIFIYNYILKL